MARRLLAWFEDLIGGNQGDLARRAGLNSRSLREVAAGRGGRKTLERLAGAVPLPLWVVTQVMEPAIAVVNQMWWNGRVDREGREEVFRRARNEALALAARISLIAFLARSSRSEIEELIRPGRNKVWAGLHRVDAKVLIRWLQSLGGATRREFAARAGLGHEALRMYESGEWPLETPALRCLAEGVGLPFWLVEGVMLPAISAVRLVAEHEHREKLLAGWGGALAAASEQILAQQAGLPAPAHLAPVAQSPGWPEPSSADTVVADHLWRRLESRTPTERVLLVKNCREFHSWSLVVRLCDESREAASDSAQVALRLALLALRVARLVWIREGLFCLQLEGFAFLHVGNSRRVAGTQRWAEEAFSRGLELWGAGLGTKFDLLPEWRVLDLEASLRRDQRKFNEALVLLNMALVLAPQEYWGRILINKATVLDQMMEPEASIAVLEEASPLIDEEREPRLSFLWSCLLGVNFCHLERYREAKDLLPKAQALAAELQRGLDNLRLEWLRGRIEAGLGHRGEALAVLSWVQEQLKERRIAYDYALVSLEMGEVLLAQGLYSEVQSLALEMEWIFTSEGIHAEATRALDLFRRAVEGQNATPELARSVVRYLYRAQHNPELKFAA